MNCNLVYFLFFRGGALLVAKMCGWKPKSDWKKKKGFGEVYLEMVRSSFIMA